MTDRAPSSHLDGRSVLITGGAGGFGRLIAEFAADRGAMVALADLTDESLAEAAADLGAKGHAVLTVRCDVTNLDDMHGAVARTIEEYGKIDAIVNNAGIMPLAFIADHAQAAEAWHRCIDVNIKGVLNGMIAVNDPMTAQGFGQVVNISSIYGNAPVVGAAVYGASKAAVNVMSEAFRVESQGKIKVTIVKPTGVPGTGLGAGVVNRDAVVGILGQNAAAYGAAMESFRDGTATPDMLDAGEPGYAILAPEHIAHAVVYALDQPWGVSIGDITVRATGDRYIL